MAPSEVNGAPQTNGAPHTNGTSHKHKVPLLNGHTGSYASRHNVAAHFIGGNHLEAAPPSKVKDFVEHSDGHTVITSVSPVKN